MALRTSGFPDDGERISASAYGRLQEPPIGPPAMSRLFGRGLPGYPGKDQHGRDCRMVNPAEADQWRTLNCTPKMGVDGKVRGMPREGGSSGVARAPNPPFKAVPPGAPTRHDPVPRTDGEDTISKAERVAEAKASAAEDEAATRRLKRLKEEGSLLDRNAGLDIIAAFAGEVGKMLDRMPGDEATAIAAACGSDEHTAYQALKAVVETMRSDLARHARAAVGGLGASGRGRRLADDSGGDRPEIEA